MRMISAVLLGSAFLASTVGPSFAQQRRLLPEGGFGGFEGGPGVQRGGGGGQGAFTGDGPRGVGGAGQRQGQVFRPGGASRGDAFGGGPRFAGRGPFNDGERFRGRHRDRSGYGVAIGAGVAGLAAGAVIGGALSGPRYYNGYDAGYGYNPGYDQDNGSPYEGPELASDDTVAAPTADSVAYCQQRYRSYDLASGTYLGYDGLRHPCP